MDIHQHGGAGRGGVVGHRLALRGGRGATLAWGYTTIGEFLSWSIVPGERGALTLSGTLATRQPDFFFRQRPLLFTAPRKGGFWIWPVRECRIGTAQVLATLGPMEV